MSVPITIERLDKRKAPLRMPSQSGYAVADLVDSLHADLCRRLDSQSPDEVQVSPSDPLGPEGRAQIEQRIADVPADLAELQLLSLLSKKARELRMVSLAQPRQVRQAYASRAVDLLQANPVLAHMNLQVPVVGSGSVTSHVPMIQLLLHSGIPLDPDRLQAATAAAPALAALLEKAVVELKAEPFWSRLERCYDTTILCRSLLRVAPQAFRRIQQRGDLQLLARHCGSMCMMSDDLTQTLALLRDLQANMPDDLRLRWDNTQLREALVRDDVLSVEHPVLVLIMQAVRHSAHGGPSRRQNDLEPQAPGYPAAVITELAEALNALLLPADRLPVDAIPANAFLRHVTLAHKVDSPLVKGYWDAVNQGGRALPSPSPQSFIEWALARTDSQGRQVRPAELERNRSKYESVIGVAPTARMSADLTLRDMHRTIDANPTHPTPSSLPACASTAAVSRSARTNRSL